MVSIVFNLIMFIHKQKQILNEISTSTLQCKQNLTLSNNNLHNQTQMTLEYQNVKDRFKLPWQMVTNTQIQTFIHFRQQFSKTPAPKQVQKRKIWLVQRNRQPETKRWREQRERERKSRAGERGILFGLVGFGC